jgi:hypothetical protein
MRNWPSAGYGETAAIAREDAPHFRGGAVLVVRRHLHDNGHAAGRVSFIGHFFINHAGQLACALLDGAVDVFARHVGFARLHYDGAQPGVHVGIAAARFRGDGDFFREAAEDLAPLCVGGAFKVFEFCPLAMTGHGERGSEGETENWE